MTQWVGMCCLAFAPENKAGIDLGAILRACAVAVQALLLSSGSEQRVVSREE